MCIRDRAERAETSRRLARKAAVGLGHESRTLLVTSQYETDPARLLERDHEIGVLFAWHAEDVFDALGLEAFHEQIGGFHRSISRLSRSILLRRKGTGTPSPVRRRCASSRSSSSRSAPSSST